MFGEGGGIEEGGVTVVIPGERFWRGQLGFIYDYIYKGFMNASI